MNICLTELLCRKKMVWANTGRTLLVSVLAMLLMLSVAPKQAGAGDGDDKTIDRFAGKEEQPVYGIRLRVHLAQSGRKEKDFLPIFAEINHIWQSQAGICFDIQVVYHDKPLIDGLNMWFKPFIGGFNGYYDGERIWMTDEPVLGKADNPAKFSAARTAAHELGHALGLPHRQDSDDNLMRSKTYGWQLNKQEAESAREAAAEIAFAVKQGFSCHILETDNGQGK